MDPLVLDKHPSAMDEDVEVIRSSVTDSVERWRDTIAFDSIGE